MMLYCNGQLHDSGLPLFGASNRGFRYGDGLFETIRVADEKPLLWNLHMERLQKGLQILQLKNGMPPEHALLAQLRQLCKLNACPNAKARLAVYRSEDEGAGYVLEVTQLEKPIYTFNSVGWTANICNDVRKSADIIANCKTANYLPYVLAARHAQQKNLDEGILCNTAGNLCDGSRTNIFLVQNGGLFTPALQDGCVAGVMRRFIIDSCMANNIPCTEGPLRVAHMQEADEVFLTNALLGIRWVDKFDGKEYGNTLSRNLFTRFIATIRP